MIHSLKQQLESRLTTVENQLQENEQEYSALQNRIANLKASRLKIKELLNGYYKER